MAPKRFRPSRAGMKRAPPKSFNNPRRSQKGKIKLKQMHAYIRAHRHEYPDLSWKEQMKILAPQWKRFCDEAKKKEGEEKEVEQAKLEQDTKTETNEDADNKRTKDRA